jgi:hypothetical protein
MALLLSNSRLSAVLSGAFVSRLSSGCGVLHSWTNNYTAVGGVNHPFRSSSDASSSHQPRAGAELGPIHVVQAGLVKQLSELGWEVKFDGHLQFDAPNPTTDLQIGKLRLVSKAAKTVAEGSQDCCGSCC